MEQLGKISFFWSMAPNLLGTNVILLITYWMSSNCEMLSLLFSRLEWYFHKFMQVKYNTSLLYTVENDILGITKKISSSS